MTAKNPAVLVERHKSRCDMILNRPQRRNALTLDLIDTLLASLRTAEADDTVTAIVLRGAEACFCSGLDLKELGDRTQFTATWGELHAFIASMRTPLVGVLERAAVNAGAALALACDLLVTGENAFLQIKEAAMGMVPPVNIAWLITKYPPALATRLTLTGDPLSGPDLIASGIAVRCVPDTDVQTTAEALADSISDYHNSAGIRIKAILAAAGQAAPHGFLATLHAAQRYEDPTRTSL